MDETAVCLTESRMTNISDINTRPEQSLCECYVYCMCICCSVARFRTCYLNSAKFVSKVRSVLGFFSYAELFQVQEVCQKIGLAFALLESLVMIQEFSMLRR
jgi:hypothetical protein